MHIPLPQCGVVIMLIMQPEVCHMPQAARREAHKATGHECQHGVWRCTICFPQPHTDK